MKGTHFSHGGDVEGFIEQYHKEPLDFSASISPLGLPEGVKQAVTDCLQKEPHYPDPFCRRLRAAIAEAENARQEAEDGAEYTEQIAEKCAKRAGQSEEKSFGYTDAHRGEYTKQTYSLAPERIICANGASDLIWRIARAFAREYTYDTLLPGMTERGLVEEEELHPTDKGKRGRAALLLSPTFIEYERALTTCGIPIRRHRLNDEEDFRLTETVLDAIDESVGIFFLPQPLYPTGKAIEDELLGAIRERCRETGTRLVIDASFADFLGEKAITFINRLAVGREKNLPIFVIRSFTKIYAMAGIRLGYGYTVDEAFLARLYEMSDPWAVSQIAQEAGIAALRETEYKNRLLALISDERVRLTQALKQMGFRVIEGDANHMMFCGNETLSGSLAESGLLVRR
ncbi:MAG: aminotransferase class I/II-fold pyridoxal phosphate-dependent enzyme, partial [Lachnospiraceae bacterium]|nr:aminotransferase class I/II-fold pyridoxal phosphate-dependent enzyme [Lachnospiraceae bacterium]